MSRSGNVWDNAAMESFFSSLKTERTEHKTFREARADVFDYIERFYKRPGVTRRSDTSALLSSSARWD
jgi:putative transposase